MLAGRSRRRRLVHGQRMAKNPKWVESNGTIPSNAIGSIVVRPNDSTGKTVYAGTGEPNGSSDSEAGVGLYKSTDGGQRGRWSTAAWRRRAVCGQPGLADVSGRDRPLDRRDRHRSGRRGPHLHRHRRGPARLVVGERRPLHAARRARQVGLYESTDGGASFAPVLILAQDTVDPTSANGGDFFRGGVIRRRDRPTSRRRLRLGLRLRPLPRSRHGHGEQIFASAGGGTVGTSRPRGPSSRSLPTAANLRVYVGDTGDGDTADFYTVANAHVAAATLFTGGTNGGWRSGQLDQRHARLRLVQLLRRGSARTTCPSTRPRGSRTWSTSAARCSTTSLRRYADPVLNGRAITRRRRRRELHGHDDRQEGRSASIPTSTRSPASPFSSDIVVHRERRRCLPARRHVLQRVGPVPGRGLGGADLTDCHELALEDPEEDHVDEQGLCARCSSRACRSNMKNPKDIMGGTQDNGTPG